MKLTYRHLVDFGVLVPLLLTQGQLSRWIQQLPRVRRSPAAVRGVRATTLFSLLFTTVGMVLHYQIFSRRLGVMMVTWVQGFALLWAFCALGWFVLAFCWRRVPAPVLARRAFLRQAAVASFALPVVAAGYGTFIEKDRWKVNEVSLPIKNLPRDLHGLRLVQLTDIHLSGFLPEKQFARVIDMANGLRSHVTLVTGDLITRYGDPLDACLRQLRRLRTDAALLGCLGNHEIYAQAEDYTTMEAARFGLDFLRGEARTLRFGQANLNFVGVDYQEMKKPYLVRVEPLLRHAPDTINVLLSHNPDVFPVAARQGFDATIAGHTHGGQVTVEYLDQYANPARFFTRYVLGLYQHERSAMYVSPGIGTIGMPVRLGTQPEVALLTLCAT